VAHTQSVRTRLTFYFTFVFGVMLVCLAAGSYSLFRHQAYSDLDESLNVAASATALSAAHELDEHSEQRWGEADLQSVLGVSSASTLSATQILIREGERTVAQKAVKGSAVPLREIPTERLLAAGGVPGLRIVSFQMDIPKFQTSYRIFAATSIAPTLAKVEAFRRILFVCIPLGLALAALASSLLAKRSLAPLNELSRTIEAITTSDLSARVKMDKAPSDLAWLAARFNSLLDRLEEAFHSQRQFMADASHELRTPLTVALSATQVTMRDPLRTTADCGETLSLVEEQIHRLRSIVDHMLLLSQVDASSLHLERREFYLDDAVSDAARSARVLARARQQNLRVAELPEALCVGDENLLKQAVLILLDNAVKYSPAGGEILVSLAADSERWRVRVWNNGLPIPAEAQPHIFQRFYRAHNGAAKVSGAGLGLPIARSIAEAHGGRVELIESGCNGTAFELSLPIVRPVCNQPQAKSLAVSM
jgi:heavy metal sensor kinase